MKKKFLFSTRTYALRKWIEKTYDVEPVHSKTSESIYYNITVPHGRVLRIRISDHTTTADGYLKICAMVDISDPQKIIYVLQRGRNLQVWTSLAAVKHEITRNVELAVSSPYESGIVTEETVCKGTKLRDLMNEGEQLEFSGSESLSETKSESKKKNAPASSSDETDEQLFTSSVSVKNLGKAADMAKNTTKRMNYWPVYCHVVPGYDFLSKAARKHIREIFSTKVEFGECVRIVSEIIMDLEKTDKIKGLQSKAKALRKKYGLIEM